MSELTPSDASPANQSGTLRSSINDESLEEARALIGYDFRAARTTIEITRDNSRDYANYVGSSNRLYNDAAYATSSRWGRPLSLPTLVGTSIIAPGLRGVQWIYGGARWRFPRLFGPGDVLAQSGQLVNAESKSGRAASSMIMQTGETRCVNQNGDAVVEAEVFTMRVPRRGASSGGLKYEKRETKWSVEELDDFGERLVQQRQLIRGPEIRYWDDVEVGTKMDEILCGPLRLSDIALTRGTLVYGIVGGGRDDNGGYSYMLDHYRRHPSDSFENPDTGVAEHPHRGHWEQYMADEVGMPGIYDIGYQRLGWLCRVVTDWMGDDGRLWMLEGWLRRPNIVGDVTYISGEVTAKRREGGRSLVTCSLSGKNQHDEETLRGLADIELLSRSTATSEATP